MPVPSWVSYSPQATILEDEIIKINTSIETKYHITAESLEKAIFKARKEGKNPRKIILNYPNNPSGFSIGLDEQKAIANICRKNGILIISDEIYGLVDFKHTHQSISKFYPEGTIILTGFSKHISMGGYRLGFAFIPKTCEHIFESLCRIGSETWSAVSSPIQFTALKALDGNDVIENFIKESTLIHSMVTEYIRRTLEEMDVKYPEMDGAFYLYPDFEIYRHSLKEKYKISTSTDLSKDILSRKQVATLPGTAFGEEPGTLRLRLAACDFDGNKALEFFRKNPDCTANELINQTCPHIIESCKRLKDYFQMLE